MKFESWQPLVVLVKLSPKNWTEFWSQQVPVKLAQSLALTQVGTVRLVDDNVGHVTCHTVPETL